MENVKETGETGETGEVVFRVAARDDVHALVALLESAYRGESSRAGWTTEADLLDGQRTDPEGVEAVISHPGSIMLAVERDGTPVACCQLEKRGESAYFGMFAVRPELQGAGLGKTVLSEAERTVVDAWGCGEMQMTVIRQREDLIAWYVRRGYRRTGIYTPFPYDDPRFGIPRRDGLAFELLVKKLGAQPS
ncbi:ribosomal protein S18 acetylase RimI-like enzyme [Streptomyces sp. Amel2xB2]|uniref:GNAT family N-acetyltransferase n=1 Tax=Streptomyces sp. Amel2xB2 TaxID=1305829 RepID=UPI000DBAD2F9|nr:GNAT family N-acetyltransferase [Streptomyces sp. Amel2xB2]RAJ56517.1 ribosomal protein S18 acetylase RimI-like enzyme [Streptomyces sp. Amel2xB2]